MCLTRSLIEPPYQWCLPLKCFHIFREAEFWAQVSPTIIHNLKVSQACWPQKNWFVWINARLVWWWWCFFFIASKFIGTFWRVLSIQSNPDQSRSIWILAFLHLGLIQCYLVLLGLIRSWRRRGKRGLEFSKSWII